jgi:putative endonuclease
MPYYLYILYSKSHDHYYIGHAENVKVRLERHNSGATPSTKHGRPWELSYTEEYATKGEAGNREKEIKRKKSRRYIEWLLEGKSG